MNKICEKNVIEASLEQHSTITHHVHANEYNGKTLHVITRIFNLHCISSTQQLTNYNITNNYN
jgi:hypothetical protein